MGKIQNLKRQWMGEVLESTFTSRGRGVGILISKNIPFNWISQYADLEGRFLVIKCDIFGNRYTLINVYFPPLSHRLFPNKSKKYLICPPTGIVMFGGDLNNIFNMKDSSCKKKEGTTTHKFTRILVKKWIRAVVPKVGVRNPWGVARYRRGLRDAFQK